MTGRRNNKLLGSCVPSIGFGLFLILIHLLAVAMDSQPKGSTPLQNLFHKSSREFQVHRRLSSHSAWSHQTILL